MATPFHRPSPWCASSYPASRNTSTGAAASVSFVSCMRSTSGRARSSHQRTLSRRAFSELTFQVAILIALDYLGSPPPRRKARSHVLTVLDPADRGDSPPEPVGARPDPGDRQRLGVRPALWRAALLLPKRRRRRTRLEPLRRSWRIASPGRAEPSRSRA